MKKTSRCQHNYTRLIHSCQAYKEMRSYYLVIFLYWLTLKPRKSEGNKYKEFPSILYRIETLTHRRKLQLQSHYKMGIGR